MPEKYIEELHKAQTDYEDSLYEIFRKSENMGKENRDNIYYYSILTILIMFFINILILILLLHI